MMQSNKAIIKLFVILITVLSELDEKMPWYLDSTSSGLDIKAFFHLVLIKLLSNDTSLDNL